MGSTVVSCRKNHELEERRGNREYGRWKEGQVDGGNSEKWKMIQCQGPEKILSILLILSKRKGFRGQVPGVRFPPRYFVTSLLRYRSSPHAPLPPYCSSSHAPMPHAPMLFPRLALSPQPRPIGSLNDGEAFQVLLSFRQKPYSRESFEIRVRGDDLGPEL